MAFFDSNALTNIGSRQIKFSSSTTGVTGEEDQVLATPTTNVDNRLVSLASIDSERLDGGSPLATSLGDHNNNTARHVEGHHDGNEDNSNGGNSVDASTGVRDRKVHGAVPHDLGLDFYHISIIHPFIVISVRWSLLHFRQDPPQRPRGSALISIIFKMYPFGRTLVQNLYYKYTEIIFSPTRHPF